MVSIILIILLIIIIIGLVAYYFLTKKRCLGVLVKGDTPIQKEFYELLEILANAEAKQLCLDLKNMMNDLLIVKKDFITDIREKPYSNTLKLEFNNAANMLPNEKKKSYNMLVAFNEKHFVKNDRFDIDKAIAFYKSILSNACQIYQS